MNNFFITCVMIVGRPQDPRLAKMSVECWQKQTYQERELLILNHGATTITNNIPGIRELMVKKPDAWNVGMLRNLAWEHAAGDHLMTWDSDDWHAPTHIEYQRRGSRNGHWSVLRNALYLNIKTGKTGMLQPPRGLFSTAIFPKDTEARFGNEERASDWHFFNGKPVFPVVNPASLFVRIHHGDNLTDAAQLEKNITHKCDVVQSRVLREIQEQLTDKK